MSGASLQDILDEQAIKDIEAERQRFEAAVRGIPSDQEDFKEESQRHLNRLTSIYREFIRRRMRAAKA